MGTAAIIRGMNRTLLNLNPGHWRQTIHAQVSKRLADPTGKIRIREITSTDLDGVIDLLALGFAHNRKRRYWVDVMNRLATRTVPQGFSQFGYMMESEGRPVGVILLLFTVVNGAVRCNESSYYVEPMFRSYAPIMMARVHRHKEVTFLNVTPARHTWAMLEKQGYQVLARGIHITVPLRCPSPAGAVVTTNWFDFRLSADDAELLDRHAEFECIGCVCSYRGDVYPMIFAVRHYYRVRMAHLIYSPDQDVATKFIGATAKLLTGRGIFAAIIDANGPLDLPGWYYDSPKYFKGPNPPPLGDLSNTEFAVFSGF